MRKNASFRVICVFTSFRVICVRFLLSYLAFLPCCVPGIRMDIRQSRHNWTNAITLNAHPQTLPPSPHPLICPNQGETACASRSSAPATRCSPARSPTPTSPTWRRSWRTWGSPFTGAPPSATTATPCSPPSSSLARAPTPSSSMVALAPPSTTCRRRSPPRPPASSSSCTRNGSPACRISSPSAPAACRQTTSSRRCFPPRQR